MAEANQNRLEDEKTSRFYGGGDLMFPSTLKTEWKHTIHFQRYEYSRADARSEPVESRKGGLITLPVPENLQAAYSANWETTELGLVGNAWMKTADSIVQDVKRRGGGLSSIKDSLVDYAGQNAVQTIKDTLTAWGIDRGADTRIGQVVSRASGLAINPFKAVLYNSPDLRTFSFNYKFHTKSQQDADVLRAIQKEFKMGMHPSFSDIFADNIFKYPDVWKIRLGSDEYLFKFLTCVLTGATFDFHGEGTKSYVRAEASIPLAINVSLNFQEIAILSKEDIEAGY